MRRRSVADRLIDGYLAELRRALRGLPSARRHQVVAEVAEHITEARATLDHEDATAIRSLLERVGDPWAIAAEAGADPMRPRARVASAADAFVPWLLLLGGLAFLVGWLIGAALLWASPTWRVRDKVLGTLVWPGGLAAVLVLLGGAFAGTTVGGCSSAPSDGHVVATCSSSGGAVLTFLPFGLALLVVLIAAPIVVAVHLERVRRRQLLGWA